MASSSPCSVDNTEKPQFPVAAEKAEARKSPGDSRRERRGSSLLQAPYRPISSTGKEGSACHPQPAHSVLTQPHPAMLCSHLSSSCANRAPHFPYSTPATPLCGCVVRLLLFGLEARNTSSRPSQGDPSRWPLMPVKQTCCRTGRNSMLGFSPYSSRSERLPVIVYTWPCGPVTHTNSRYSLKLFF